MGDRDHKHLHKCTDITVGKQTRVARYREMKREKSKLVERRGGIGDVFLSTDHNKMRNRRDIQKSFPEIAVYYFYFSLKGIGDAKALDGKCGGLTKFKEIRVAGKGKAKDKVLGDEI